MSRIYTLVSCDFERLNTNFCIVISLNTQLKRTSTESVNTSVNRSSITIGTSIDKITTNCASLRRCKGRNTDIKHRVINIIILVSHSCMGQGGSWTWVNNSDSKWNLLD